MTPEELRSALAQLRISQNECASRLGVRPETVNRWVNGKRKRKLVPGPVAGAVARWLTEKRK